MYMYVYIYIHLSTKWLFECPRIQVDGKTPLHLIAQWGTVDVALPLGEAMKCAAYPLLIQRGKLGNPLEIEVSIGKSFSF